jgi:hypothetical protein
MPTKSIVVVVWAGPRRSSPGLCLRKTATSRQNREVQFPRLGDRTKYAVGAVAERVSQKAGVFRNATTDSPWPLSNNPKESQSEIQRSRYSRRDQQLNGISGLVKLFTYTRCNAELSGEGQDGLGLKKIEPAHVQQMDSIKHIDETQQVGCAVAEQKYRRTISRVFRVNGDG